jgi:hypothetical protein
MSDTAETYYGFSITREWTGKRPYRPWLSLSVVEPPQGLRCHIGEYKWVVIDSSGIRVPCDSLEEARDFVDRNLIIGRE